MNLREQLSEAEALVKDLETLQSLPDLLNHHDAAAHRLFMLTTKVEVPEELVKKEIFEPRMVEAAATLVDVICNDLKTRIQVEEVKKERGDS